MKHELARILPVVNACLNGLSAVLLASGYRAIRRGERHIHGRLMVAAFSSSTVFLISYLTRYYVSGTHRFAGAGLWKAIYLVILFSHMLLAMAVVPLALRTLYLAARQRFEQHLKVARITFPLWMYVSVTGVVVYFMLYHFPP
jgi:putative membrane protein